MLHYFWIGILLASLFSFTSLGFQTQRLQTDPPGIGPFSRMSMRLVKRLLLARVDVLDLEVHFGLETAEHLGAIADGRNLTVPLENSIAEIATRSQDAYIRLRFLRDIELRRFLKEAQESAALVYKAKIISRETFREISHSLPTRFGNLQGRGIKKDDLMLYRVRGNGLRTIYRGIDGRVYIDQEEHGEQRRLALLGSYFVPDSEFRNSLIRSLFSGKPQLPSH